LDPAPVNRTGRIKEPDMMYPDLLLIVANDRRRELIADADRRRLLSLAREARRERTDAAKAARVSQSHGRHLVARGQPAGTLAACGPHAAAPAR
jgi:hypothetical protein